MIYNDPINGIRYTPHNPNWQFTAPSMDDLIGLGIVPIRPCDRAEKDYSKPFPNPPSGPSLYDLIVKQVQNETHKPAPVPNPELDPLPYEDQIDEALHYARDLITDIVSAHTLDDGEITEDGRKLLIEFQDRMDKVLDGVDSILDESQKPYTVIWYDEAGSVPEDMTDRI